MLTLCRSCSGFVPDDCARCPHCQSEVIDISADARDTGHEASCAPAKAFAIAHERPNAAVRIMRRVVKGTLIAGSSMVLAACYGCPPDQCEFEDDFSGTGGDSKPGSGGSTGGRGSATGGRGSATGGRGEDASGGLGGDATGGLGGLGGLGGDAP